jgi:hypothetical protein
MIAMVLTVWLVRRSGHQMAAFPDPPLLFPAPMQFDIAVERLPYPTPDGAPFAQAY